MANESVCIMAQFTEVLKKNPDHAYDFISNNYWKMDKAELVSIVKELLYGIHQCVTKAEHDEILENVGIELDEQYDEIYQEE